ncbi:MAG TPA: monovalent cation/H(+) antiporter subunit G [Beutenbergiaceae bacterium]|nr:monovalent cation/H(+) antiporter subunit G [Beutenbergiaceae bacterium]
MWSILGQILILAGAGLFVIAAVGLLRFPDVYTRISAVGTAAGLGIGLVVVGALAVQPGLADGVKVVAIVVFQLCTSAVATSAMGRAAYLARSPLNRITFDELTDPDQAPPPH